MKKIVVSDKGLSFIRKYYPKFSIHLERLRVYDEKQFELCYTDILRLPLP